jgi:Domain of unknown function (DUF4157)
MPAGRLSQDERTNLGSLGSVVDCSRVRLYRSSSTGGAGLVRAAVLWLSRGRPVALGNHVFIPERWENDVATLAHELTHCAQYQAWGPVRYFARGVAAQVRDLLYRTMGLGSSPYHYHGESAKPFSAYGMEQQGQIVEDCFRGHPTAKAISPFHPGPPRSQNQATPSA